METMNKIIKGTVLKMLINFEYPSNPAVTLDAIDFRVEYFTNPQRRVVLEKGDLFREEEEGAVNYYAYVDTGVTGAGFLAMRFFGQIPDGHAPSGMRTEYVEYQTNVRID